MTDDSVCGWPTLVFRKHTDHAEKRNMNLANEKLTLLPLLNYYFYPTWLKKYRHHPLKTFLHLLLLTVFTLSCFLTKAQPITGVWKGKIDKKNVELKIIKKGDSLTGTSYYYQSPKHYAKYSIKGYFDDRDNSVIWWDEELIEEKGGSKLFSGKSASAYKSVADFNCPGGTKMYLNGKAALKSDDNEPMKPVDLQKYTEPMFPDEWDYVINNYTAGANDPKLIDSISQLAYAKPIYTPTSPVEKMQPKPISKPALKPTDRKASAPLPEKKQEITRQQIPEIKTTAPTLSLTNEQKFVTRSKQVVMEIPLSGDSIELSFYDNAIVDGDSIAIFLNNQLMAEHILLTEKAYVIKLAVNDLQESNELVMVAENLGSIPPNTSLMMAYVDGKRYEARLESSEQSSAMIRFVRKQL